MYAWQCCISAMVTCYQAMPRVHRPRPSAKQDVKVACVAPHRDIPRLAQRVVARAWSTVHVHGAGGHACQIGNQRATLDLPCICQSRMPSVQHWAGLSNTHVRPDCEHPHAEALCQSNSNSSSGQLKDMQVRGNEPGTNQGAWTIISPGTLASCCIQSLSNS